jgi:Na+:H+ antiporter, NhaA family
VSQIGEQPGTRLELPVDIVRDHVLGPDDAEITLVEYGSYDCPHCRAANEHIADARDQLGGRLRYVFRHRPLPGSELARRAAELVERAAGPEQFWKAHIALMMRSASLTEDDLRVVASDLALVGETPAQSNEADTQARERVAADERSAIRSGASFVPTFFINGRRYDGPWDADSFADVIFGSLGHRVRAAALDFASWAPSAGVLLLLASVIAVVLTNSTWGPSFSAFWQQPLGFAFGGSTFLLPVLHWVDDALLTVFFLVVGLEIKREFTVGHLATRRSAALPIAAALGGMIAPALIYAFLIPAGPWSLGWGVPMATDTAFAIALIVMMGRRVPVAVRIFLTAAAIVDDIGSILVVAVFYSGDLSLVYLGAAAALVTCLALLNRWRVYRVTPYLLVGVLLWICIHAGGLHATLSGVLLALFIPTRAPPNLKALMTQAHLIIESEAQHGAEVLRHGPSLPAMRALDAIHARLESPADRMLRQVGPLSSYLVLPLFAIANAGVLLNATVLRGHGPLMLAIIVGLVVGKPLGLGLASALAVRLGWAVKPDEYSWRQLIGAGALAGIGFTMSLFIAEQSFLDSSDFAAAKIAIFTASILSAVVGIALLWRPGREAPRFTTAREIASAVKDSA